MAKLVINKTVNDSSGGTISPGAIIGFDTTFTWGTMKVSYTLKTYRSWADYEAGKTQVYISNILNYGIEKIMTEQEYVDLVSNGLLAIQWLKTELIASGAFIDADLTISL